MPPEIYAPCSDYRKPLRACLVCPQLVSRNRKDGLRALGSPCSVSGLLQTSGLAGRWHPQVQSVHWAAIGTPATYQKAVGPTGCEGRAREGGRPGNLHGRSGPKQHDSPLPGSGWDTKSSRKANLLRLSHFLRSQMTQLDCPLRAT